MTRITSIFAIAVAITAGVVAIIAWLVPMAGEAVMAYIRQDPDGPFWVRVLTPMLPAVSFMAFALVVAVRRRKAAKAGSDIASP